MGIVPVVICIERDTVFQAEKKQASSGQFQIEVWIHGEAEVPLNDLSTSTSPTDPLYYRLRMDLSAILPALKTKSSY